MFRKSVLHKDVTQSSNVDASDPTHHEKDYSKHSLKPSSRFLSSTHQHYYEYNFSFQHSRRAKPRGGIDTIPHPVRFERFPVYRWREGSLPVRKSVVLAAHSS